MKNKLLNFIAVITIVIAICIFAVGYYELQKMETDKLQSKAIIAQAAPRLLIAKGRQNIDNAIAFSIRTQSAMNIFAIGIPYLIIFTFVLFKLGRGFYEEIQKRNSNTNKN